MAAQCHIFAQASCAAVIAGSSSRQHSIGVKYCYHLLAMDSVDRLASSFDSAWGQFLGAWKRVREKATEESIHDLRVSTRRLLAAIELLQTLSPGDDMDALQRRFKKVLKHLGPLRDVQVQLEKIALVPEKDRIAGFKRNLKRRERDESGKIRDALTRNRRQRLTEGAEEIQSRFAILNDDIGQDQIRTSVACALSARYNHLLKARRQFYRCTDDQEALHAMRIALKKLRYLLEAAQPVLGRSAKQQARRLHALQQLMGDSRDLDMFCVSLQQWATSKGKTIDVLAALDDLKQKRDQLLRKIVARSVEIEHILTLGRPGLEPTGAVIRNRRIRAETGRLSDRRPCV
jgi:CHAD domain-containing protein